MRILREILDEYHSGNLFDEPMLAILKLTLRWCVTLYLITILVSCDLAGLL